MENFSQQPPVELQSEPLSDQEVHELLDRLGAKEFGGSEQATIGAVAEATGSDAVTIGRLLAEIRKEDFEKRFGLQLGEHEARLETLEERTDRIQRAERTAEQTVRAKPMDPYAEAAIERLAEREQRRQEMRPYAIVLAIIMFIVFIAMIGNKNSRYSSPGRSVSVEVGDGQLTMDEHGDMWVQKPDGTRRNPTDEERQRGGELGSLLVGH